MIGAPYRCRSRSSSSRARNARPRALVLVDGSGPAHATAVKERASRFERERGRAVRVLPVAGADDAIQLARRGEAEVALVPEDAPLGDFVSAAHAADAGRVTLDGAAVRVLEVNVAQHPKVDGDGAKALAAFLVGAR